MTTFCGRFNRYALLVTAWTSLVACGKDEPAEEDTSGTSGTSGPCMPAVDVLLVIDNSRTMGEEQARLANAVSALIGPLDSAGIDWRVGVTTTDNGNPACSADTTPEGGSLVASSCKARLAEFQDGDVDARDLACNSLCSLDDLAIQPTATTTDPTAKPRPWLEKIDGQTNLAAGTDPIDALRCMLPMGVRGCNFEAPLESMYLALRRSEDGNQAEFEFLRPDAGLLVIIVSDGSECSYNRDWFDIFAADGSRVFWSDPTASAPTSAVCWNAGVECKGDPSAYTSCDPIDLDINGDPTSDSSDAVLNPLSRYTGILDALAQKKVVQARDAIVRVSVLTGTPQDGTLTYSYKPGEDPIYIDQYGIMPGCVDDQGGRAVPPVRTRDLALHTRGDLYSVCASGYGTAMASIVAPFVATCE